MKYTIKILMTLCATVWLVASCTGSNPVDSSPDIGSWQLVGAGLPEGVGLSGLAFNSKGDIFAGFDWIGSGCDQCGGIYRSTDSVDSWSRPPRRIDVFTLPTNNHRGKMKNLFNNIRNSGYYRNGVDW